MPAPLAPFTCPTCSGALHERATRDLARFTCRLGHVFPADTLLAQQGGVVERALWAALRALEERRELLQRLAAWRHRSGASSAAARFEAQVEEVERRLALIRQVLESSEAAE